jgi:hypothetical protein
VCRLSMYALQEELYMAKHTSERSRGLRGCLRNNIVSKNPSYHTHSELDSVPRALDNSHVVPKGP